MVSVIGRHATTCRGGSIAAIPLRDRLRSVALVWAMVACTSAIDAHADISLSPPQFDASLAAGLNDNVGQAERGRDIVDDTFFELSAGGGYLLSLLGGRMDATGRAFVAGTHFDEVQGLGHWGGGAELGLEARLTRSPLPPFLRVLLRAEGEDYDFDQRDSTVYTGTVEVGMNLGPRVTVSIGGEYRDRLARSDVFDLAEWSASFKAGFDLAQSWRVNARATYVDGDVWSTIQTVLPNGDEVDDIFDLIAAADVIQRDDAFNDAFDGLWFTYRLPATTNEFSLSATRTFGERLELSFEWLEIRVKAERDNDYDNRLLQLSCNVKF